MKLSKFNIFTSNGLFIFGLLVFLIFFNFKTVEASDQVPVLFFFFMALIDLILIGLILVSITTTIELSENGIEYNSLFKKVNINWTQINSYGVYVVGSGVKHVLDKAEYDKFIWGGQKFIYITGQKEFFPAMFKRKPKTGYIDFHYRQEAMQIIEHKMESLNLE